MTEAVVERAPAKVNPYLRVVRRRDDGFHDIETIVVPLDLADTVTVRSLDLPRVSLRVTGPRAAEVPQGDDNLVVRAANTLAAAAREGRGADITLDKHVPVAAGLGGGSADAAATIRALDRLWRTDIGSHRLLEVAARVSSDVPSLLLGGAALATGRGDRVTPVDTAPMWWVLVTFDAGIRAEDAYRWWDRGVVRWFRRPPPIEVALRALADGDVEGLGAAMFNSLQPGVASRHPSVRAALIAVERGGFEDELSGAGAVGAVVAGSGPTIAGLCRDEDHAVRLAATVGGFPVRSPGRPRHPRAPA